MIYTLDPQTMVSLREVALGREMADLVIVGGDVVNVYSGEIIQDQSIAIKGKWIAYVGPNVDHCTGANTERIDASGRVVIPGFIDGHTHLLYYCSPGEFLRYAMKGGTTTIITELVDVSFAFQYQGLIELLEGLKDQPIKVFATVSPCMTLSEGFRKRSPNLEELIELLKRDDVVGVGEGYWQDTLRGDPNFPALSAEALRLRKTVEGHAAGCREKRLNAYLSYGVSSCHESTNPHEVIEKVRAGIWVMIREGSVRKELHAMSELKKKDIGYRRLVLVTDSVDPCDLIEKGYMEFVVQRAIDLGFDPITAIQMATLNPAEHFRLDNLLGGIAPGKYADIVIIHDLENIDAEYVISNGQVISHNKEITAEPRKMKLSVGGFQRREMAPDDFKIVVRGNQPCKVAVIDQITELVTREAVMEMSTTSGEICCDPEKDILKISLITWEGKVFTGLIRGLGMKKGALATSYVWEGFGVIVAGENEEDMAFAVNRVFELRGGIAVYSGGEILTELALPIGGMISDLPLEALKDRLEEIESITKRLGFRFDHPLLTLSTITTPAIPFLRISEHGLVDLRTGSVVELIKNQ